MQVYGIDFSKEKFDVNFIDSKGKEERGAVRGAVFFQYYAKSCNLQTA